MLFINEICLNLNLNIKLFTFDLSDDRTCLIHFESGNIKCHYNFSILFFSSPDTNDELLASFCYHHWSLIFHSFIFSTETTRLIGMLLCRNDV
jgi:hypothetical protein